MKIDIEPGTYVLAVSGGVDSMVLLDAMATKAKAQKPKAKSSERDFSSFGLSALSFQLIVAHFNHGIRPDSEKDKQLVEKAAKSYGLPFVYDEGRLGEKVSEDQARKARYKFLQRVKKAAGADAIVTAHHQDDLLETAILNLLRGTGRKGLTSLGDDQQLRRPLLGMTKKQLRAYAKKHGLKWREDPTNTDTRYRRNYVREHVVKQLTAKQRAELLGLLQKTKATNQELDAQMANFLQFVSRGAALDRKLFINLPHALAVEVMAAWLRQNNIRQFDKKLLEKLTVNSKTLAPGKQVDVDKRHTIKISRQELALVG